MNLKLYFIFPKKKSYIILNIVKPIGYCIYRKPYNALHVSCMLYDSIFIVLNCTLLHPDNPKYSLLQTTRRFTDSQ